MHLRRLRAGEWIAGISGAALLVSLFLPWYGADTGIRCVAGPCPARLEPTAWESLAAVDILLFSLSIVAIALPLVAATQRTTAIPIMLAALATLAGLMATVLVLVRLAFVPDVGVSGDVTREAGLYLALAGAAGIVAGGVAAMRDERQRGAVGDAGETGGPGSGSAEIELVPTPPARPTERGTTR